MASGWIKLHRQIQDCWIWDNSEPFSRGQAWIDLLMLANHEDHKTMFDGQLITVPKGSRITSIRKLAERWGWGRDKTMKFLNTLQADKMIEKTADTRKTVITIVNYGKYQSNEDEQRTPSGHSADTERTLNGHSADTEPTQTRIIKNDKNYKNEKNEKNIDIEYSDTSYPHTLAESHPDDAPPRKKKGGKKKTKVDVVEEEAPVELIPLNDGSGWRPTLKEYDEYKRLYPSVDIDQEFRSMRGWCLSNPKNKKTQGGVKRFVNSWLSKRQDRARRNSTGSGSAYIDRIDDRIDMVDRWVERMEKDDATGVFGTG